VQDTIQKYLRLNFKHIKYAIYKYKLIEKAYRKMRIFHLYIKNCILKIVNVTISIIFCKI